MSKLYSFDPNKVIITVGDHTITGYDKESMVSLTRDQEETEEFVGRNDTVAVHNPVKNSSIEITLLQTSDSNEELINFLNSNRAVAGSGVFTISIVSKNGVGGATESEFFSNKAYVKNDPVIDYNVGQNSRTWMIKAIDMDYKLFKSNESQGGASNEN